MPKFRSKVREVKAYRVTDAESHRTVDAWPRWLREAFYRQPPQVGTGQSPKAAVYFNAVYQLMVRSAREYDNYVTAVPGSFIVLEDGKMSVWRDDEFIDLFEAA